MANKTLRMKEVVKLTGLSQSLLRIWELRYGWPKPTRGSNGYRQYDAATIDDLKWIKQRLDAGKVIRELIADGKPTRDKSREVTSHRLSIDFSHIPQPSTKEGQKMRKELENAIINKDTKNQEKIESLVMFLHPSERELAIFALVHMLRK